MYHISIGKEVVNIVVYILNRSPCKYLQNITPEESWSGRKPSVSNFHVFGCISFAHIPKEKRSNLDAKSKVYMFVGYSEQSKAY
jgi:hypothetical protein